MRLPITPGAPYGIPPTAKHNCHLEPPLRTVIVSECGRRTDGAARRAERQRAERMMAPLCRHRDVREALRGASAAKPSLSTSPFKVVVLMGLSLGASSIGRCKCRGCNSTVFPALRPER